MVLGILKRERWNCPVSIDIELDKDYVVFQGGEQEAPGVYLNGILNLQVNEPLSIEHIRLHLSGVTRICLPRSSALNGGWKKPKPCREEVFYNNSWEFSDVRGDKAETLPLGVSTYPFNVVLEDSLPETVEGLDESSVAYFFTVEIGRKYGKDIIYKCPLRVIRALDPIVFDYCQDMIVDNVWANKIAYRIHLPTTTVPFGTSLDVDYEFTTLLHDLEVEYIESQLLETQELTLNAGDPESTRNTHSSTKTLLTDRYIVNVTDDKLAANEPGYRFSRSLDLPRSLGRCVQDTDIMGIKISHQLKIFVRLHNPDGHSSEVRLTIPVSIYLSPYYRIWEGDGSAGQVVTPPKLMDDPREAPPPYGEHMRDQLYNGIV